MSTKGPHSIFPYCETEWMFKKFQRVSPFTFFGTMRLTGVFEKIRKLILENYSYAGTVEENT